MLIYNDDRPFKFSLTFVKNYPLVTMDDEGEKNSDMAYA